VPMLEAAPGVRAIAIFEEICRRHPDLAVGVRRTLERRVARWRALNGPSRSCGGVPAGRCRCARSGPGLLGICGRRTVPAPGPLVRRSLPNWGAAAIGKVRHTSALFASRA